METTAVKSQSYSIALRTELVIEKCCNLTQPDAISRIAKGRHSPPGMGLNAIKPELAPSFHQCFVP